MENIEKVELTCINCPLGCALTVSKDAASGELIVTGNTCPRGADYARKEVTDPRRIVTSTVRVEGGTLPVVSVKTERDIPKGLIFEVMKAINSIQVNAPVHIGDVILADVCQTGVAVIATQNVCAYPERT